MKVLENNYICFYAHKWDSHYENSTSKNYFEMTDIVKLDSRRRLGDYLSSAAVANNL